MKWQTQRKIGVSIITVGVAPLLAVMLVGLMASFTPLDTPVQLRAGVFQSPEFWTYTEDPYFVMLEADEVPGPDLDSVHCLMAAQDKFYRNCDGEKQSVDFDWKIVPGQGQLLASGRYEPIEYSGTGIGFAEFQAHPFARQRVILEIHQDGGTTQQIRSAAQARVEVRPWARCPLLVLNVANFRRGRGFYRSLDPSSVSVTEWRALEQLIDVFLFRDSCLVQLPISPAGSTRRCNTI